MGAEELDITGDLETVNDHFYEERLSDGLPIIPPTRDRVDRMVAGTDRAPDETVAEIPPEYGEATVEKIAANAVMAGCKPEYLPVVIAAIEAMTDDRYNLYATNATTHNSSPLVIVNGPIVDELNINYGHSVLGSSGWRANSTIGRAVRLIMINLGRSIPGETDKATLAHPGKYTFCIAENKSESPWDELHVRRGFDEDQSAVTVYQSEAPIQMAMPELKTPQELLPVVADTLSNIGTTGAYYGGEQAIVFGPSDAEKFGNEGWTVPEVQRALYNQLRNKRSKLKAGGVYAYRQWPKDWEVTGDDDMVPMVEKPEDIIVLVAGGVGAFSAGLPGWGSQTWSVTKPIDE